MVDRENPANKVVLGWREAVALPEWDIARIRAKVDTGARTSSIHVASIDEIGDGKLAFDVVVRRAPTRQVVRVEADLIRMTRVRPSSGRLQERPVVETLVRIGGVERRIELSLVCREKMLCRMLLGRRALDGLLVDPSHRYLASERPGKRRARSQS